MPLCQHMTRFLILFNMREKMACFELCFTCTDAKSRHLEFLQFTGFEKWETSLIF